MILATGKTRNSSWGLESVPRVQEERECRSGVASRSKGLISSPFPKMKPKSGVKGAQAWGAERQSCFCLFWLPEPQLLVLPFSTVAGRGWSPDSPPAWIS